MIAGLSGRVAEKLDKSAVIDVQGVRYEVHLSASGLAHLPNLGEPIALWTRLIPSEDSMTLYGFGTYPEQQLFDLLVTVTGVGPKLALNILNAGPVSSIVSAISQEKPEFFLKVTRLGKKTASKLILDLKTKVEATFPDAHVPGAGSRDLSDLTNRDDIALQALVELGYNSSQAKAALAEVSATDPSARVKEALQKLGSAASVTR
ncbi:MAG: Holliday junction branch migration protein RuvA [Candidatus Andersenbacteria bacterium]